MIRFTPILATVTATAAAMVAVPSGAASLDLTDGDFSSFTPNAIIPANADAFSETDSGATFTFFSPDNLVGSAGFQFEPSEGIILGGGGGSVVAFSLSVDTDVILTGYMAGEQLSALTVPLFSISLGGTDLVTGQDLSNTVTASFDPGVLLIAGQTYDFSITNPGAVTLGTLSRLDFELADVSPPPGVPAPGALGLLGLGLAALGLRRRQR